MAKRKFLPEEKTYTQTIVCRTIVYKAYYFTNVPEPMSKRFGKRLREARLRAGLSQEELAAKARLHRTYVGMIERAKRNITLSNAESLAKALGMKLFELIRDL